VEVHVRIARLTDIDAAASLLVTGADAGAERRERADRLRTLLFVPAATVLVAEAAGRMVGVGVLSIRPSIAPGPFIGVIDAVATVADAGGSGSAARGAGTSARSAIAGSILEQLVISARNKGCARVDVADPLAASRRPLFARAGFERQGALLSRAIG